MAHPNYINTMILRRSLPRRMLLSEFQLSSRFSCSSSFVDIQRPGLDQQKPTSKATSQSQYTEQLAYKGFAPTPFINGTSTSSDVSAFSTVRQLLNPLVESVIPTESTDANMIGTAKILSGGDIAKWVIEGISARTCRKWCCQWSWNGYWNILSWLFNLSVYLNQSFAEKFVINWKKMWVK